MASLDGNHDYDWIEELKSEGSVPFLHPDDCSNGWASPPGDIFKVRGSDYFNTKEKIPGGDYLLKPLGFDWIKGPTKLLELLKNPENRVKKALNGECSKGYHPFVWAFNLQLPTKENHSAVAYFVDLEPRPEDSLITRFLKEDDVFRNSRLKLIANIVKGPWIVRTAVGEQAICIVGRALKCKYSLGENYIEVDIDIGSSVVANAILHLAFGYLKTITVDLAFVIEGQTESELPEQILGAFRFSDLDANSAIRVEIESDSDDEHLTSQQPAGFWKSIGQGFSNIIRSGSQENDSNSTATQLKGSSDQENK